LPFEIVCSNCGVPLYSGVDLKQAGNILKLYNNKCKTCGKLLSTRDFTLKVEPLEKL